MVRGWLFCSVMLLGSAVASAANADSVRSVRQLPTGIEVRTEAGILTLEPWSDSILHVRFGPAGYQGNYSPAVVARPAKVRFTVGKKRDASVLATSRLTVRIAKKSATVSFADASGQSLFEEAQRTIGGGTTEAFGTRAIVYGLGQHLNGLLDYSGNTVHLQQMNGDVAVPMLVSPSGFGILWNNASVMHVDVAKPGEKYPLVLRNEAGAGID